MFSELLLKVVSSLSLEGFEQKVAVRVVEGGMSELAGRWSRCF